MAGVDTMAIESGKSDQPAGSVLETERLRLRPFLLSDAARVRELAGDERIADVTARIPHPYPEGVAEAWIASHDMHRKQGTGIVYAVTLDDDTLIGAVSIMDIDAGAGELGYWIGVPYWGYGYGTEAVRALLDSIDASGALRRIHARHLVRNPASGRVLLKAGFRHRGRAIAVCGYRHECEPVEAYERLVSGFSPRLSQAK